MRQLPRVGLAEWRGARAVRRRNAGNPNAGNATWWGDRRRLKGGGGWFHGKGGLAGRVKLVWGQRRLAGLSDSRPKAAIGVELAASGGG